MTPEERGKRMALLCQEPDALKKKLIALGLIADALAPDGLVPVIVGGTALEFYTAGGYMTKDVDIALPTTERVNRVFSELGFAKEGRYWIREDLDLLFEAPTADLEGETAPRTEIAIEELKIVIIGIEDLLLDRLRAWAHWQSEEDGRWTRRLAGLYRDRIDWAYLESKAAAQDKETAALTDIRKGLKP